MPHTISDLISSRNLSEADVKATLNAAGLPLESESYSEEDISKFDVVRSFFADKKVSDYEAAKELFEAGLLGKAIKNRSRQKGGKNPKTPVREEESKTSTVAENFSISELIQWVNSQLGLSLSIKQVATVFEASNLPDKEFYTLDEAKRFLRACTVLTQNGSPDLAAAISTAISASEKGLIGLVDTVTSERARQIPELIKQLYLQNVTTELIDSESEIETFFFTLQNNIINGIEGKTRLKTIMEVDLTPKQLPESETSASPLQGTSENTTTIDINSELMPDSGT